MVFGSNGIRIATIIRSVSDLVGNNLEVAPAVIVDAVLNGNAIGFCDSRVLIGGGSKAEQGLGHLVAGVG